MKWWRNLDYRIKRTIVGGIIIVFILFLLVFIIGTLKNRKLSYTKLEEKITLAAKEYYKDHESLLPIATSTSVTSNTLVKEKYIKDLSNYTNDNCSSVTYVEYNDSNYLYTTELTCSKYSSLTLSNYIKNNEKIVSDNYGLYNINGDLIYRGEKVNNYLNINGKIWRILRINEDGTIRIMLNDRIDSIIWDDRFNIQYNDYVGINDFNKSRLKDYLVKFSNNTEYVNDNFKRIIVSKNVCLDKKDHLELSDRFSIDCISYSEEKYMFTLINFEEYYAASIDLNCNGALAKSCTNYNYLNASNYWTITPLLNDTSKVIVVGNNTSSPRANSSYSIHPVTTISNHVLYGSGDGSSSNPYIIKY